MQNYHIEKRLAQGSTSSVFRVLRVSDRGSFVMKRVALDHASPRAVAAAERELALFQQIDHPCIRPAKKHSAKNRWDFPREINSKFMGSHLFWSPPFSVTMFFGAKNAFLAAPAAPERTRQLYVNGDIGGYAHDADAH